MKLVSGSVNFTLELIGSWFSGGPHSAFLRENSTVASTIFSIISFEAVARRLDDVSNNRLKVKDVQTSL